MNKKIIIAAIAGMFTLGLAGCEQRLETEKKPAEEGAPSTTTMPAATPATPATPDTTAPVVPVTPVVPTTPATGETPAEPAKQ
jgi:hypothetical protein